MSAELLAKLRVKNQPVKIDRVDVKVKRGAQREAVVLKTKIENRVDPKFNREQFMVAIAEKFQTVPKIPKPSLPKPDIQLEPALVQVDVDEPKPIKKPKKLKKKLKLVAKVEKKT